MDNEELARTLEREYYAIQATDPQWQKSLREYLHDKGFSYKWLTQHGYTEQEAARKHQ